MEKSLSAWEQYKKNLGETRPWDMIDKENYIEKSVSDERLSICKGCPELIKLTTQCKKCGCFMAAKTKLKMATCPIGKW
jgi:hypothetical protein